MSGVDLLQALAGGLLLFFVPGAAVARAVFPEWSLRGPAGRRHLLETVTLGFVLSVVLTILAGEALLTAAPGGFAAGWTDPLLEAVLAGIALVAFVAGLLRGGYGLRSPAPTPARSSDPEGAWELTRQLDHLEREARSLERSLRQLPDGADAAARTRRRLNEIRSQVEALQRAREAEYAR